MIPEIYFLFLVLWGFVIGCVGVLDSCRFG